MNVFETLLTAVSQIKTAEQWGYALGCVNTEYAHDFITKTEYDILFKLIQDKKDVTALMKSIKSLTYHGVPYRVFVGDNAEIVVCYNEYGDDHTDEVYAADGSLIRVVDVTDGYVHIQGGVH